MIVWESFMSSEPSNMSPEPIALKASGASLNSPDLWLKAYPWPDHTAHKYKRGHVLVMGGDTLTGASRLAAMGALRAGAGLVTLAAPLKAFMIYATALTSVMVKPCDGLIGFTELLADVRRNVVVVGPGANVGEVTRQYVLTSLNANRSLVLDADSLTSFADDPQRLFDAIFAHTSGSCVLTPHEGEFAQLFNIKGDRLSRARAAATLCGAIIVLKGPETIIAAPDGRLIINKNAPPYLATGGSGDVLTGFIAGLLAQGFDAFYAAAAGVWLQGEVANHLGLGLIAEDLPDALPHILKALNTRIIP
jgi:ADP-dependent NAD(P)H-hydrate dehydratase / NAD(P)H-hydrate epimerase